jgi:hypothetical protein
MASRAAPRILEAAKPYSRVVRDLRRGRSAVARKFAPRPNAGWIGALVTRLTLISAIAGLAWPARQSKKKWHLIGFAACAMVFFAFLFQDGTFLNRMEESAQQITS